MYIMKYSTTNPSLYNICGHDPLFLCLIVSSVVNIKLVILLALSTKRCFDTLRIIFFDIGFFYRTKRTMVFNTCFWIQIWITHLVLTSRCVHKIRLHEIRLKVQLVRHSHFKPRTYSCLTVLHVCQNIHEHSVDSIVQFTRVFLSYLTRSRARA